MIGYLNGMFERMFYDDDIKLPIGLIGASELFYGIITYVGMYMLRGDFAFGERLVQIILPRNWCTRSWSPLCCTRSSYMSTNDWKQKNKGVQVNLYNLWERIRSRNL